jgi:TPP-dependent pyruvate/acetoin dehydrogenase alpha subunit
MQAEELPTGEENRGVPPLRNEAGLSEAQLEQLYYLMKLARALEDRLFVMYRQGKLVGSVFLARGQEAMEVGCAFPLRPDDVVSGTHRDQILAITKGMDIRRVLLNYFGKRDGPTRGRDGNSHFHAFDIGVMNVVSHLPDGYPLAVGAALAFKLRREPRVALAMCGEGATNNGTWHEAMNLAAVMKLPFIAVVQNNQYAYSTPNWQEFACESLADRAKGYGIPGVEIDGNDILQVVATIKEAAERARSGGGPTLVVGQTFRQLGHAGHDGAEYVPQEVRDYWLARDPIARFEAFLESNGLLDPVKKEELESRIKQEIAESIEWAQAQPDPLPEEVSQGVYA